MIIVCAYCGADLRDRDCECRRPVRTRSHLMDVVMTAASMGRVDAETLRRAAADRGVRHGGVAAAEELAAEELAS